MTDTMTDTTGYCLPCFGGHHDLHRPPCTCTENGHSSSEGERRRDDGIGLTSSRPGFGDWADAFETAGVSLLRAGQRRITSENIVYEVGPPPEHHNQVGAAMRAFAVRHSLRNVGTTKAIHPDGHARRITVWEVP